MCQRHKVELNSIITFPLPVGKETNISLPLKNFMIAFSWIGHQSFMTHRIGNFPRALVTPLAIFPKKIHKICVPSVFVVTDCTKCFDWLCQHSGRIHKKHAKVTGHFPRPHTKHMATRLATSAHNIIFINC